MWDPKQYARFGDERSRPFHELLSRLDVAGARRVTDLGCGDGALTGTLRERWPAARVQGIDSSSEMIAAARRHEVPGELEFSVGTIEEWEPAEPVDVLVSNAALQWVPGHRSLLPRLAGALAPGGHFAFQVPGNFRSPTHLIVDELCAQPRWSGPLGDRGEERPASNEPHEYLETLLGLGLEADVWETTYCHVLRGDGAVVEWLKGTRLRPVLAALDPTERDEFLRELGARLDRAYPPGPHGTVLPFRRIFATARRPTGDGAVPRPAVAGLDHVQVAIPAGGEPAARAFYAGLLGLAERAKPEPLAARGGCWFRGHGAELHLGIEEDFRPSRKAHVALAVEGLDALAAQLSAGGHPVRWDDALPGRRRFYADDPFGNRLELMDRCS